MDKNEMSTDFIIVGAGSAGCVMASELLRRQAGSVCVIEAGPSERHPLVSIPFGLVWLLGSRRDWRFKTTPQKNAGNREINIPRGKMVGGSGSINSMVWFRGRMRDFDNWNVDGWRGADVSPVFDALEATLKPTRFNRAHPMSQAVEGMIGANTPSPDHESSGLFQHNMIRNKRHSSATAYLRRSKYAKILTGTNVDRLIWAGDRAAGVILVNGREMRANKGVVLCAGSLASPAILMRSGLGDPSDLAAVNIDPRHDMPEIGQNLHDHPDIGLHFQGHGTGHGLELQQWGKWALSPLNYALFGRGPLASSTCEAGAFFNARGDSPIPDIQTHFIPFYLAASGSRYQMKSGYLAGVCLCQPKSRGSLRLSGAHANASPHIDFGMFNQESDLDTMVHGITRLRNLLRDTDFGARRGVEFAPGEDITGQHLRTYIRNHAGTAYHPVGTLRLGGPITSKLRVKNTERLWVADASIMPQVTSANTNAPSMMIGWQGAKFIASEVA